MRCIRLDSKSVSRSDVNAAYEEMLIQLDADFGTAFSRRADLEKKYCSRSQWAGHPYPPYPVRSEDPRAPYQKR